MREILFRGQALEGGAWIEGHLMCEEDGKWYIVTRLLNPATTICSDCGSPFMEFFEVDPATVGQFTGLTDRNGKRVFDWDICKHENLQDETVTRIIRFGEYEQDGSGGEYNPRKCFGFYGERIKTEAPEYLDDDDVCEWDWDKTISILEMGEFEVVGNIHDNPELIGGQESDAT